MGRELQKYQTVEQSINKKFSKRLWRPFITALKQYELITDERIDLSAELARTSQVEIEKVTAIRNDKEDWVFYVKPTEGEAVTIMPDAADLHRFFNAVKDERMAREREEMNNLFNTEEQ